MSSLVGSRATTRSRRARRLVLAALVVVLSFGVLAMHGLTSAAPAELTGASNQPPAHVERPHDGAGPHESHDGFGHLGVICLWLAIGGAALLTAGELGLRWARRRGDPSSSTALRVTIASRRSVGRAPPSVLAAPLRC